MSTLKEVIDGVNEPITLEDAKEHLRVTGGDEDTYISYIITAARTYVENELGETLHESTYNYYLNGFPSGDIETPKPPLISVTYVKYYDTDNVLQTLVEDTDYRVDVNSSTIEVIDSWPSTYDRKSSVQIRFISGYENLDEIEALRIHAMKLKLSVLYDDRHSAADEKGLISLMNKLKEPSF